MYRDNDYAELKKQANAAAKEQARQQALAAKKAKKTAAKAEKEAEAAAKERARQEAKAWKKAREATAKTKKEADTAVIKKWRQQAEASRKAEEAAAMAKKEAEKAAKEKARLEAMEAKKVQEAAAMVEKSRKPVVAMVPLFSRRSVMILAIGFIVGAGLGLAYWNISSSLNYSSALSSASDVPWASKVNVQVVNPGSSYMSLVELQRKAEYFAAKANSLPFLEYLGQELGKQAPQYSHTVNELDEMIRIRVKYVRTPVTGMESELPAIELEVTGASSEEALFIGRFVPQAFNSYLIAEEKDKQKKEYQNTLVKIESGKKELLEAEREMIAAMPTSDNLSDDPTYVALNAKIKALELEVDRQAVELTTMIAKAAVSEDSKYTPEQEYQKTLQKARNVSVALASVEQELHSLEKQKIARDIQNGPNYIMLDAKIRALQAQLDMQMTGYNVVNGAGEYTHVSGLAELIALGITTGLDYENMLEKVQTTSAAIAEAKKELSTLESQSNGNSSAEALDYQLAQARVDTLNKELTVLREKLTLLVQENVEGKNQADTQAVYERTSAALAEARTELASLKSQAGHGYIGDPDYDVAQAKVSDIKTELTNLTAKLSSSLGVNVNSEEIIGQLVAGNPSIPLPVLPERIKTQSALMMSAIIGIGGAWVLLNFKWLAKGMPSSGTVKPGEDEEEA